VKKTQNAIIKVVGAGAVLASYAGTAFAGEAASGAGAANPGTGPSNLNSVFSTVTDTLIFLVGAISVIYLIIGGLKYIVSNGDPKAVESAKNTILYAIIGVIVALVAFALVSYVIGKFNG
jgi:hypothetical protein